MRRLIVLRDKFQKSTRASAKIASTPLGALPPNPRSTSASLRSSPSTKASAVILLSALGALASGCIAEGGSGGSEGTALSHERVGQAIQPIINGSSSGTEHDSVVILATFVNGQRKSLCSATLVAPNLILTARHCVSDTDSTTACSMDGTPVTGATVHADRDPTSLAVFVGKGGVAADSTTDAKATARGLKLVVDATTTVCNHDVAFLVLDKKLVDTPVASIRLGAPTMTETLSAVGWGIDATGSLPTARQERRDIPLIGLGPSLYPDNETYGYGNAEFMVGESACAGDSGSPAIAKSGAVVGVAARAGNGLPRDPNNQASTCIGDTAHAVYTHLGLAPDLVTRAFKESGEEIWLEGKPDPRAPKPASVPAPPPTTYGSTQENTKKSAEGEPVVIPTPAAKDDAGAGGCSMSSEPQSGSVEYAAGLVALFASLLSLRRRFGSKKNEADDERALTQPHRRQRLSSMP